MLMIDFKDTIYALSSPWGISGVAVIRVSGSQSRKILKQLCSLSNPISRKVYLKSVFDLDKNLIDKGLVSFFESPYSFTGEDVIEFHLHGSNAVVRKLLSTINKFKGLRPSEPGEFSKRAFINKKINLLEAEGINNLINAETEQQRQIGVSQSFGSLNKVCNRWKDQMLEISSIVDAQIEFEEEDENIVKKDIKKGLLNIVKEIKKALQVFEISSQIVSGLDVLIFGPPNAGKSSMFNLINKEKKSIVSKQLGTTRDQITSAINLDGFKINLLDSAGLRISVEKVEKEGIQRTLKSLKKIKRLILVLSPDSLKDKNINFLTERISNIKDQRLLVVYNKSDLKCSKDQKKLWISRVPSLKNYRSISISCVSNDKNHKMYIKIIKAIKNTFFKINLKNSEDYFFTELRHKEHLKKALRFLEQACSLSIKIDILSEEIRLALAELEKINGKIDFEDKLSIIFSKFCIGK